MRKLKTVWRVARQTFFVLLITFFLTEIAFRFYNYIDPSFVFYNSSYNRFRGKPNAPDYDFHLNSKGFKDVEFDVQKEKNTYRILGLGDSFAFAVVPYQYAYLTLLEEILNQSSKKTELINMGIPATNPKDYFAVLMNEGLELKPDLVLISFFIGNDFVEKKRKLYTYSYVASFINYLITVNRAFEGGVVHPDLVYNDTAPRFSDSAFLALERERSEIYRRQSKQFESDLATTLSYLKQIKQQCDLHHIALAVLLIPDEVQVNQALQSKVLKAFSSSKNDFDFTLPNRLLAASLKEENIDVFDLLDDFSRASSRTTLYKPNDTHWNIAGNKLAAEMIAQNLFHVPQAAMVRTDP
jgi:SGNH hydrolase-like domain, acetyltransferase AlgX